MSGHDDDTDIRDALHGAVADVEPAHRLEEIRARTSAGATEEDTMKDNKRTWLVGVGGAVVATAAVIVTFAVVGNGGDDGAPTAGEPTTSASPTPSEQTTEPAPTAPAEPSPDGDGVDRETQEGDSGGVEVVVPVYYTVDTPVGPRLVREFRRVGAAGDGLAERATAALDAAVSLPPADPDYATRWPADSTVTVSQRDDDWLVTVESAEADLRGLPDGVDAETGEAMRQQLLFTLQGVIQERAPVELVGSDADAGGPLLGGDSGAVASGDELETLALMNITNPVQGQTVRSDTLRADGRSSGFEASVAWEVRAGDADGEVVERGVTQAEGWMDGLYPWEVEVDVSDLEPGAYTFVARNDDPTGGTEGVGDSADTKAFTLE